MTELDFIFTLRHYSTNTFFFYTRFPVSSSSFSPSSSSVSLSYGVILYFQFNTVPPTHFSHVHILNFPLFHIFPLLSRSSFPFNLFFLLFISFNLDSPIQLSTVPFSLSFRQRLWAGVTPNASWGPALEHHRQEWKEYCTFHPLLHRFFHRDFDCRPRKNKQETVLSAEELTAMTVKVV